MVKKIFKFLLSPDSLENRIDMPADAEFLSAQIQNGALAIWVLVDIDRPWNWLDL